MQIPHRAGKTTTLDRRSIHRVALFFCLAVLAKYQPARTVEPATGQTPAPSPTSSSRLMCLSIYRRSGPAPQLLGYGVTMNFLKSQLFDASRQGPGLGTRHFNNAAKTTNRGNRSRWEVR